MTNFTSRATPVFTWMPLCAGAFLEKAEPPFPDDPRTIFSPCGTHAETVSPRQAANSSADAASAKHPHAIVISFFMFVSFL